MTAARLKADEMPLAHRQGLSRVQAATYCGISVDLFGRECPVAPIRIGSRVVYLRDRLDAWLASLQVDDQKKRGREWTPDEVREAFNAAFPAQHRKTNARKR